MAAESIEERKARLQALRLAAELSATPYGQSAAGSGSDGGGTAASGASGEEAPEENTPEPNIARAVLTEPVLRFRNYFPRDEKLQELKVSPPEVLKFNDPVARDPKEANGSEDPILSIAPKKANWDIRRDVAKKLEKLEKRTQRAIIELMQEEEKRREAASEEVDDMT